MSIMPRNIGISIILSLLTCGIYYLYWVYKMDEEVSYLIEEQPNPGLTLILGIITCGIYFWFWYYQLGEKLSRLPSKDGYPISNDSVLLVILAVFSIGIISNAIAQSNLNKVV